MDCARLFCFGFDGMEAPDAILFALDRDRVGAVILFARNCADGDQLRRLTRRLREAGGEDLWILVDQEGGRVQRVTDPDIGPRGAGELASAEPEEIEADYRRSGEALAQLGIDFNLAPVADVLCRNDNPAMAERTFGTTAETVSPRVAAAVGGIRAAGLKACAKHFPGLGDVHTDPHLEATRCTGTLASFRELHFRPFAAAVAAGVDAVMTTHLLAPSLDPDLIATYSPAVVQRYLEGELRFRGLVLTDDLEMKGLPEDPARSAWNAFCAGHHLLLLCHRLQDQQDALRLFASRIAGDSEARQRLHRCLQRQEQLRRPFPHG